MAEERLTRCLTSFAVRKGEPHTHVSRQPPRCYFIGNEIELERFYTVYQEAVNDKCVPTVLEKPGEFSPVRFDFDLKYPIESGIKLHRYRNMLKPIARILQEEVNSILENPDQDECYIVAFFEKTAPRQED